jgi:uncharacterized protein
LKRLVVDASTLVSGVASRPGGGPPWLILAALLDFDFEAVVCPKLIGEFRDALNSSYFQGRFDPDELEEIVSGVTEVTIERPDPSEVMALLRDPDDDYLVALAWQADAEAIVTGDRDLLDHPGLTPPAFDARRACAFLGLAG